MCRRKFRSLTSDDIRRDEKQSKEVESEEESVERRSTRAKVRKVANRCFSNDFWFGGVEKWARSSGGCGGRCSAEKSKIARRCGANHVCRSKCTKHTILGPLLEVQLSKNCTPLWSTFVCQNAQNTSVLKHLWRFGCQKGFQQMR